MSFYRTTRAFSTTSTSIQAEAQTKAAELWNDMHFQLVLHAVLEHRMHFVGQLKTS